MAGDHQRNRISGAGTCHCANCFRFADHPGQLGGGARFTVGNLAQGGPGPLLKVGARGVRIQLQARIQAVQMDRQALDTGLKRRSVLNQLGGMVLGM